MLLLVTQACGLLFLVVNHEQFPSEQVFVEEYIQTWCEKAVNCGAEGDEWSNLSSCISVHTENQLFVELSNRHSSSSYEETVCTKYRHDMVDRCFNALEDWSCEELKDRSNMIEMFESNSYDNYDLLLLDSPIECFQPFVSESLYGGEPEDACDFGRFTHPDAECFPSEETVCAFHAALY